MRIGLYYHSGTVLQGEKVAFPSYLAMFVEELARQAGSLVFYGHSGPRRSSEDRVADPSVVRGVDLGPRRSFPIRTFWPWSSLRRFDPLGDGVDVMMVRGPTPLLPHLVRAARCRVVMLLVGDYRGWTPGSDHPWWRTVAVRGWIRAYDRLQARAGRRTLVLANSPSLTRAAEARWPHVREVFTSSLAERDAEAAYDEATWDDTKGVTTPVRALFAGRIAEEKGLGEAIEALELLRSRGHYVTLELVGWADDPSVTDLLVRKAEGCGVADRLSISGYLRAGPELLDAYRRSDLFLLPSRARRNRRREWVTFEGFPRSIVEAMAVGRPVVASKVGGIADRLGDDVACLIRPNSPYEIAKAIENIIGDPDLRANLVRNGRRWASQFTNERSCALIMKSIRDWMAATGASARSLPDRYAGN